MGNSSKESIRNRWKLLGRVAKDPKLLTRQIMNACSSQGALAKLEIPNEGITRMTLNTLKTNARLAIETLDEKDGWAQLEERRLHVRSLAITLEQDRKSTPRKSAQERISELQLNLDKSDRQRLRLLRGYSDLLGMLRPLARNDPALLARLKRHLATFSIRNLSVVDGGVDVSKD